MRIEKQVDCVYVDFNFFFVRHGAEKTVIHKFVWEKAKWEALFGGNN